MSRTHSDRLNAKKVHRGFAAEVRRAANRLGSAVPPLSVIPAEVLGAEPLPLEMPAFLDCAFGYPGNLRFVQFGYSYRTREFAYCDGGDDIPSSSESVWKWFLNHSLISPHLPEERYPTLHGIFPADSLTFNNPITAETSEWISQENPLLAHHCLLLDRQELKAYVARREQNLLFLALTQPEDKGLHTLYIDELLMSSGMENYEEPRDEDLEALVRRFFDVQLHRRLRKLRR